LQFRVAGLDRDLSLLLFADVAFALGFGLYAQLFYVYALRLGASRFTIGALSAIMLGTTALGYLPGAWAAVHFRLKSVIVWVWWLTVPCALSYALAPSWPWLIPGLVLAGLYMANNPALKTYILLKSEPSRASLNMMLVFGGYSVGMIVAPSLGGLLAAHAGMRVVFLFGAALSAVSATLVSFINDTPYRRAGTSWTLGKLARQQKFRHHVAFFLIGFLAIYVAQPFLAPFLAQVHSQSYVALGLYAALASLGAAVMGPLCGYATDRWGPRIGVATTLPLLLLGMVLLLYGQSPPLWAAAFLACGAFDALRFSTSGIVGPHLREVPLAWGYAVFDASMGIPMVAGSLLGGLLFRESVRLPLAAAACLAAALLVALAIVPSATASAGERSTDDPL
jgi:predicted MFS family arabinose efflux permease